MTFRCVYYHLCCCLSKWWPSRIFFILKVTIPFEPLDRRQYMLIYFCVPEVPRNCKIHNTLISALQPVLETFFVSRSRNGLQSLRRIFFYCFNGLETISTKWWFQFEQQKKSQGAIYGENGACGAMLSVAHLAKKLRITMTVWASVFPWCKIQEFSGHKSGRLRRIISQKHLISPRQYFSASSGRNSLWTTPRKQSKVI